MDSGNRVGENLSFAQALEATYEAEPRQEKWECLEPDMNLKESVGYFRDVMARLWGWRHELG